MFDHSSIVANGNGNVALNNDLLLVDAAINLANGQMNCDSRVTVGQNLGAATIIGSSPPLSSHSDHHPGFPSAAATNDKLSLMNDSNNNALGSNGSLNGGGSSVGSHKQLYGHLMNGNGGRSLMIGGGQNMTDGSSSASQSPLLMKSPLNMQLYQQQWQQQQQQQQQFHSTRQHQLQFLHGLQEQQHRLHQNVSKGANSPNAIGALNGECCPKTNSVLNIPS